MSENNEDIEKIVVAIDSATDDSSVNEEDDRTATKRTRTNRFTYWSGADCAASSEGDSDKLNIFCCYIMALVISKKLERTRNLRRRSLTPVGNFRPRSSRMSFKPFEHDAYVLGKVAHRILSESADNYIRTLLADA